MKGKPEIKGRAVVKPRVKARLETRGRDKQGADEPVGRSAAAEQIRLAEDAARTANWKRWGPYLSERQWATVREDYSADGNCWDYFPHDHARSRAYRWGEDGLLGITDRECRLCFSVALWNGKDPILKERLFGLTGPEGNHGEDCKECYYYLDSSPTHSYMKALYKYTQHEFPYARLVAENRGRGKTEPELELIDTGVFEGGRYFDVTAEYAKASPDDILIRITIENRASETAELHVLPTLWFRNTWSWGASHEYSGARPRLNAGGPGAILASHETLGKFRLSIEPGPEGQYPELLFTENVSNTERLFRIPNDTHFVKDAFHSYVVGGDHDAVNPNGMGTKAAAYYRLRVPAGGAVTLRMRLTPEKEAGARPFKTFDEVFAARIAETDAFYDAQFDGGLSGEERNVARQAAAGLMWSKQFYHYVVEEWLKGDSTQPAPPAERWHGRNADWRYTYCRDVISMPDKWEYPWFAAWDLAFHMVALAKIDPQFAKDQLILFLREWYMHPSGQIPAYEFAFGDVNPPVHAWACWRVYKMTGPKGGRDRVFLARVFQKLLINFTWWVNRKDPEGKHLFAGGFLGLDNIGVFDRSRPLPTGGHLEQADGTAWMAFYCGTMLSMALELASEDPAYEDVASKFFEHFVAIVDAMNSLGGTGLWDEDDGFYYDQLLVNGHATKLKIRSMVGIIPLFAVEVLEAAQLKKLPGFTKRLNWFLENRRDLARHISYMSEDGFEDHNRHRLLAIPTRERLERTLRYVLDETEFLAPHGVRSLSRVHLEKPYVFRSNAEEYRVRYTPGESDTSLFGGNSNWRGPIWFPVNYLIVEALERYHHFYGESLMVECPVGTRNMVNLAQAAAEIRRRLGSLFLPDAEGKRPCHGGDARYADDPAWKNLLLFHEYFHGETGRGLGASHQTGWTALAIPILCDRMPAGRAKKPKQLAGVG